MKDGGRAFPRKYITTDKGYVVDDQRGMTYRQWLAGMALQGMLSSSDVRGNYEDYAKDCLKYADAVIEEGK